MVIDRRIRLGSVSLVISIDRDPRPPSAPDAWLDTLHRLAVGRAEERARLGPEGRALRARLTERT